jgi:hypothetical protein
MKQLFIVSSRGTDLNELSKGAYAFVPAGSTNPASAATKLTSKFAIYVGGGDNVLPYCLPEVDINTLTVQKSTPTTGVAKKVTLTIPATEKGKVYNFTIVKKGVVFNERSNWSFSEVATGTSDQTKLATAFVKYVNANNSEHKVTASNTAGVITLQGTVGYDFEVTADFASPTVATPYVEAANDTAAIKQLASMCAAGKGINYLAEDGKELYPNYLADVAENSSYVVYTLRFAVGRDAAKQRDERVWQIVHIAVLSTNSTVIGALDTELGITDAAAANTVEED